MGMENMLRDIAEKPETILMRVDNGDQGIYPRNPQGSAGNPGLGGLPSIIRDIINHDRDATGNSNPYPNSTDSPDSRKEEEEHAREERERVRREREKSHEEDGKPHTGTIDNAPSLNSNHSTTAKANMSSDLSGKINGESIETNDKSSVTLDTSVFDGVAVEHNGHKGTMHMMINKGELFDKFDGGIDGAEKKTTTMERSYDLSDETSQKGKLDTLELKGGLNNFLGIGDIAKDITKGIDTELKGISDKLSELSKDSLPDVSGSDKSSGKSHDSLELC